ncbi:MAG: lysophospholipid acyltransferase family protein [Nitrospirota bacterium]|nr:lysophospholipid acyltransferase family protein [Nitrospirota bacterium]
MDYRQISLNPQPGSLSRTGFYRFSRSIVGFLMRTYIPTTIRGTEHIPSEGGVIIASNHLSVLDVPLLGYAIGREARFPAKPELFTREILSRFLLSLGGFPITRGEGDRKALSFSEQVLRQGGILSIFPEGTRSRDGVVHSFHRGVALLAMSAGVPIVPAAIWGSDRSFPPGASIPRPARIFISFGPPEWPEPLSSDPVKKKEASLHLTERTRERVCRLLESCRTEEGRQAPPG